jgi:hypothetical protein
MNITEKRTNGRARRMTDNAALALHRWYFGETIGASFAGAAMGRIRCYDCGQELTVDEAVRRNVTVRGTWGGVGLLGGRFGGGLGTSDHAKRVDLCRKCNEERARRRARKDATCLILILIPVVAALLFLVLMLVLP